MPLNNESHKISLPAAIAINLNIMVGVGLFINTSILANIAGAAGCISYALLAILILPLIMGIAKLVAYFPSGGFYAYAQPIHPFAGFISTWSYFTGKLASAVIMVHSSMLLLQQIIPVLNTYNICILDSLILILFLALNLFNLKTGQSVQALFLTMKLIPICFVVLSGLFLFSSNNYATLHISYEFFGTLPLVLFTALGFEAATSLSGNIKDAAKNAPRAILLSYAIVMALNILYQFFFYGILGEQLANTTSFLQAFPLLLEKVGRAKPILQGLFNIAIASSALGGTFGILFSNNWNLYTLAKHKKIVAADLFTQTNRYGIPYMCIAAQGAICFIYLFSTQSSQIPLQQIAAFGCSIAYTISICSLALLAWNKKLSVHPLLALAALANCTLFLASCVHSFYQFGHRSLIIFALFMALGTGMFIYQEGKKHTKGPHRGAFGNPFD